MPVNNKNTQLVLCLFKRILENMKHEANVLNNFEEFGHVRFCIEQHRFKKEKGSKRCLGVVERFNKTICCYLEVQRKLMGPQPLADVLPDVLDLYNRYHNQRGISDFFRRNYHLEKGTSWYKKCVVFRQL